MRLYTLGCTGWIPLQNETCCFLIEHKGQLIMLDAGTGVSNIVHFKEVVAHYQTLHIILTHYHLDHIIGLSYLLPFISDKKIDIFGPGIPSYQKSTGELLNDFLKPEFFSRPLEKLAREVSCYDYGEASSFNIGEIKVSLTKQKHSSPSFSVMLDNDLLYVTDTVFDRNRWEECPEIKLLLHECWQLSDDNAQQKHCSLEAILKYLPLNKFGRVLLIHQNPLWNEKDVKKILELTKKTNIEIAQDLRVYDL